MGLRSSRRTTPSLKARDLASTSESKVPLPMVRHCAGFSFTRRFAAGCGFAGLTAPCFARGSAVASELGVKGQYPVKTGVPASVEAQSGPNAGPLQGTANAAAGGMSAAHGDAVQPEGHRE